MVIRYKNASIEKQCNPEYAKTWKYPKAVSEKLLSIMNFIDNAETLLDVAQIPPYHFHQLKGKRKGEWSIYIGKTGYRLTLIPLDESGEQLLSGDIINQCKSIRIVLCTEVSNHYE